MMAMIRLAKEYGNGAIMIGAIAKSENIPQRFLENILLELKNLGFLGSKLGKSGGYFLLKNSFSLSVCHAEIFQRGFPENFESAVSYSFKCTSDFAERLIFANPYALLIINVFRCKNYQKAK